MSDLASRLFIEKELRVTGEISPRKWSDIYKYCMQQFGDPKKSVTSDISVGKRRVTLDQNGRISEVIVKEPLFYKIVHLGDLKVKDKISREFKLAPGNCKVPQNPKRYRKKVRAAFCDSKTGNQWHLTIVNYGAGPTYEVEIEYSFDTGRATALDQIKTIARC